MLIKLNIPDRSIKGTTAFHYSYTNDISFPIAYVDKDSYIWNATVNTGIEFTLPMAFAVHNLHVGRYVPVADGA